MPGRSGQGRLTAAARGAQVAIKFEHHSSKGCPGGGPPNEWAVYQALGESHGIPRLYFKGSAADFYIMVRRKAAWAAREPVLPGMQCVVRRASAVGVCTSVRVGAGQRAGWCMVSITVLSLGSLTLTLTLTLKRRVR